MFNFLKRSREGRGTSDRGEGRAEGEAVYAYSSEKCGLLGFLRDRFSTLITLDRGDRFFRVE